MRGRASVLLLAVSFITSTIIKAQPPEQIEPFQKNPDGRVYFEGRPVDAILLPDGSVAYLLEWPLSEKQQDPEARWVLIAHPVRGDFSAPLDPITGQRVPIGTDPGGTYHGFAWFMDNVPFESEDGTVWTPLYETHPPNVERTAPYPVVQGPAVQKWWAAWDDWLENLSAGELVPHSGVVSSCRETEEATIVTMKGDGTFEFLYRDRDRITYEGLQMSSPCDVVGLSVVVWTLPCDGGPCIRKIQAGEDTTESPKPATAETVSDAPVPHSGRIADCRPREGITVVTVKGDRTFQFLYRNRDRVVFEGVRASSPCDLMGRNVVVWTVACEEDGPCISRVEAATGP
jgi:hypothetical protein